MDPHQFIVALTSTDPAAQRGAKAALDAADPAMIDGLLRYGRTTGRKETAQKVVVRMGRKAVPTLLAKLEDESVAAAAGSVLFRILGPLDADRIPALLDCARRLPKVKNYCIQALVTVAGPKAATHASVLAKALSSDDLQLRVYAIVALGSIGKGAASASPALRQALKDPVPEVRKQAQKALRRVSA